MLRHVRSSLNSEPQGRSLSRISDEGEATGRTDSLTLEAKAKAHTARRRRVSDDRWENTDRSVGGVRGVVRVRLQIEVCLEFQIGSI